MDRVLEYPPTLITWPGSPRATVLVEYTMMDPVEDNGTGGSLWSGFLMWLYLLVVRFRESGKTIQPHCRRKACK
jgi:hypothetical protein